MSALMDERNQKIVEAYRDHKMSYDAISQAYGLSKSQVGNILRQTNPDLVRQRKAEKRDKSIATAKKIREIGLRTRNLKQVALEAECSVTTAYHALKTSKGEAEKEMTQSFICDVRTSLFVGEKLDLFYIDREMYKRSLRLGKSGTAVIRAIHPSFVETDLGTIDMVDIAIASFHDE